MENKIEPGIAVPGHKLLSINEYSFYYLVLSCYKKAPMVCDLQREPLAIASTRNTAEGSD